MGYITDLKPTDYVGISFWLISLGLTATTAFFVLEQRSLIPKWQLPVNIGALVTGIAAIHYFYMRYMWVKTGKSPITRNLPTLFLCNSVLRYTWKPEKAKKKGIQLQRLSQILD